MYLNPYPLLEQALLSDNPDEKGRLTQALFAHLGEAEGLTVDESKPVDCRFAGHPLRPCLVAPSEVTPRKMNTVEGYAAMLHAIAHIEFNAINLALDAAYRFRNMPLQFYTPYPTNARALQNRRNRSPSCSDGHASSRSETLLLSPPLPNRVQTETAYCENDTPHPKPD